VGAGFIRKSALKLAKSFVDNQVPENLFFQPTLAPPIIR